MRFSKKNLLVFCLLILGFVQFGSAQTGAKQIETLLDQGEGYLEEYEFEKAVAACDEALKKIQSAKRKSSKKLAEIYYLYGRIYEEGLYLGKAIAAYTSAIKFNPRNVEIYQSRAKIYEYIGETKKAEVDFEQVEKLIETGKNSNLILSSPTVAMYSNPAESVVEYHEEFQRIGFKEVSGYEEAVNVNDSDKDGKISDEEFRQAHIARLVKLNKLVKFNPKGDLALWKRGDFFLQLDEISNQFFWISTEGDFIDAFEINPRYEYLVNRGVVRARRNNKTNYEFAVEFFSDAIAINNKCLEAFYNRGLSYRKLNENEKAIADFTEVIKLKAGFALAYKSRAKAFRAIGKIAEAETDEAMLKRLGGK